MKMLSGGGKPSPELEKAMAELHGLGRIESLGSASMDKGMRIAQRHQGRRSQEIHRTRASR